MEYSPPDPYVHGILQARTLDWVANPFSRRSSWPRGWTQFSYIAGVFFTVWATRETQILEYSQGFLKVSLLPGLLLIHKYQWRVYCVSVARMVLERQQLLWNNSDSDMATELGWQIMKQIKCTECHRKNKASGVIIEIFYMTGSENI